MGAPVFHSHRAAPRNPPTRTGAAPTTGADGATEDTGVDGHALPEVVLNREHSDYMWATREQLAELPLAWHVDRVLGLRQPPTDE